MAAVSDFLMKHLGAALGTAGVIGFAHGLHKANHANPSGVSGFLQEAITGDPAGVTNAWRAEALSHYYKDFTDPYAASLLGRLGGTYPSFPAMPRPSLVGPRGGPSGNVVFGLYNLRS